MRVTNEMMVTGSLRRLQGRLERYERAQTALATGRWVNRPSDDPAQASRGLTLRAAMAAREQELRAADDARGLVDRADGELQSASAILQRVRELNVAAASPTSPTQREALALEVDQLREQLISIANADHRGRALFAGFGNGDVVGASGAWASPEGLTAAQVRDQEIVRQISDSEAVTVNVTAADVFGFAGPTGGTGLDTFTTLANLSQAIRDDARADVSAGLDGVDAALGRVYDGLASLGAAGARIESARQRTVDSQLTLRTELSEVEDVDVAEAIMDLQVEETAYQATLQALGRSLPDTLVSFLR